ncbi:amidase [Cellulomonas algicola]|uniref:Amidase n=1 Tax=Cellulomonas algicola TaxID=2071633 RepID=A0A401UVU4_9CELL|nr:allophanate hydrolase [Cellulomonas algicola]GCD18807.1 amidase [Cellulomonas algicola]
MTVVQQAGSAATTEKVDDVVDLVGAGATSGGVAGADGAVVAGGADGAVVVGGADGAAVRRVRAAFERLDAVDRPEAWITFVDRADVLAAAAEVDARVAAGADLPLAGVVLAVKDNVDVAGLPTTAACPSYATSAAGRPGPAAVTAPAVQRLVDAGAVVLGKTNLDQFATGLVGTRSPFGAVRHATLPDRVSGGSSSGSAVAVALGIADVGIGTDTAGSGRVPAAFHGIVGIKTTVGLVPTAGVVPACRTYDVVTTFTRDLALGALATRLMVGPDAADPSGRTWPADVRLALRATPVVAVPRPEDLAPLSPGWRAAFDEAVAAVVATGARVRTVDVSAMLDAATLLYDGAIVAERYEAVGAFLDTDPVDADPTVAAIIRGGRDVPAHAYVADRARLDAARADALVALDGCDLLLLPTTTEHPTIAAVQADPVGLNRRLGTYTNFVNLLDLAAVAVPAGEADGGPFGVTVIARAFDDQLALDLAARLLTPVPTATSPTDTPPPAPAPSTSGAPPAPLLTAPLVVAPGVDVLVVGAHLRGQPLNGELEDLGARFVASVRTSDAYRLVALDTTPRKPGLVRVGPGHGAPIAGEVWRVAPGALGRLLAALPGPLNLGQVELEDGTWVVGFGCTAESGLAGADLTWAGGWVAALRAGA